MFVFVPPSFPESVTSDSPVEVQLRLTIDYGTGAVREAEVESGPSPNDREVIEAARWSMVLPNLCIPESNRPYVRATLVFALEENKQIVTLRDPKWFASDPSPSSRKVRLHEPREEPRYPKKALARRDIHGGIVMAHIEFGPDGKAIDVRTSSGPHASVLESPRRLRYRPGNLIPKTFTFKTTSHLPPAFR